MSQLKLTANSGGGTVAIKGPASTTGNAALELTVPSTASDTLDSLKRSGNIVQVVSVTKKDTASNSTASGAWWSYTDNSLKITLTPQSASNKIYLTAFFNLFEATGQWLQFRFEEDGAQIDEAVGDAAGNRTRVTGQQLSGQDNNGGRFFMMSAEVNADSTSSRTYNLAFRHTSGVARTLYLNRTGDDTDNIHYGRSISILTAMEVAA
tara:strand:+ start:500 stop:1123 length:624 start_codon:yes stop_codon:yes gene_type:complete